MKRGSSASGTTRHPQDNPPQAPDGTVEVPAWRHALINYPHPLLKRGLVVIDTPGLNAIGAEPELTLGLLPSAHATVFILGADTGVTKSDLEIWREHLDGRALERFVVLNKIDTLADPLSSRRGGRSSRSCSSATWWRRRWRWTAPRVFPLSARDALAARVAGDDAALQTQPPAGAGRGAVGAADAAAQRGDRAHRGRRHRGACASRPRGAWATSGAS